MRIRIRKSSSHALAGTITAALPPRRFFLIPDRERSNAFRIAVPQSQLQAAIHSLHRILFPALAEARTKPCTFAANPALLQLN